MQVSELTEAAKAAYEAWLDLGMSEAKALEEASALHWEQVHDRQMADLLVVKNGIPFEEALQMAKAGHRNPQRRRAADPFDAMVESFVALGMTPEAAKAAVMVRETGTESEVRADLREAHRATEGRPAGFDRAMTGAIGAAQRFHSFNESDAFELIKKRLLESQPADPVAYLNEYARSFGSGPTAKQVFKG